MVVNEVRSSRIFCVVFLTGVLGYPYQNKCEIAAVDPQKIEARILPDRDILHF